MDDALGREILAELRVVRRLLEERTAPRAAGPLNVKDRRVLDRLLPVIAVQFPGSFETWEIFDASRMPGIAGNDLRLALGALTAHRCGKLLRKAADSGVVVAGYRVTAAGRAGAGGRWRCVADPSSFSDSEERSILSR